MATTWIDNARAQLAPYGYTLAPGNTPERMTIVRPTGTLSGVFLTTKRRDGTGPMQARAALGGSLLWSGHDAGAFVRAFWFAEKRA